MTLRFPAGILPHDLDWNAVEGLARRYSLGVVDIDKQHRMLFAWYEALRKAPKARQVAEGLVVYAAGHFEDEERWALGQGIDIAEHRAQHLQLMLRLDELLVHTDRISVMSLVFDWLTTHIDIEDRELVRLAGHLAG